MDKWLSVMEDIGRSLFGRESSAEMWSLVVVCVFFLFFVYHKMSAGFIGKGNRSFLVLIPGVLLMVLAAAAVQIYLSTDGMLQAAAAVLVFLAVVLPLTKAVEKTSYLSALFVWGVCALVLTAILLLEKPFVQTIQRGIKKGSLVREHQDYSDKLIDKVGK